MNYLRISLLLLTLVACLSADHWLANAGVPVGIFCGCLLGAAVLNCLLGLGRRSVRRRAAISWFMVLLCSGLGLVMAVLGAWLILIPVGQTLIDSADEDVVLATIRYFKWGAAVFIGCWGCWGAEFGWKVGRWIAFR
jgi:hypothetical protein